MKKKFNMLIIIIMIVIISPYIIGSLPIKKVERNINTVSGEVESIDYETNQVYVKYVLEGCGWRVIGKNGVLFNKEDFRKNETIFIVGNFPNEIHYDLLNNTFVLDGKYLGKKTHANETYGCFEVYDFGVLGQLKRDRFTYLSKSSLTIMDCIAAQVIPHVTLDDLEDAEE